jgi:hypothetical protein
MFATSANVKPQKNFRSTTLASSGSTVSRSSSASLMRCRSSGTAICSAVLLSSGQKIVLPPRFCARCARTRSITSPRMVRVA